VLIVAVIAAIAVGTWMWIAPALAVGIAGGYAVADRRMKQHQTGEERELSQLPGRGR
jgi:uncharacterized protein YneF (UPF0154 family)